VRDVDLALSQISNIREQLAANTRFLGISPGFNTILGVLAFFVAAIQTFQQPSEQINLGYVAVWGTVIIASYAIIAIDAMSRSHRLHGRMAHAMLKSALQKVLPFASAGIIVTWVICSYAPESVWLLPGFWMILISLLGFSVLSSVPRGLAWVAGWYFLCGSLVMIVAGSSGILSPWMMGIPFSIGHLAVAACMSRAGGGNHA